MGKSQWCLHVYRGNIVTFTDEPMDAIQVFAFGKGTTFVLSHIYLLKVCLLKAKTLLLFCILIIIFNVFAESKNPIVILHTYCAEYIHYCFPVSLYSYFSLLLWLQFLPEVFCPLTTPAYFHRFLQCWYQNVQLLQEMCALCMCFGISHFYTF